MAILIADTKLETETDAWYMFYADTKEDINGYNLTKMIRTDVLLI